MEKDSLPAKKNKHAKKNAQSNMRQASFLRKPVVWKRTNCEEENAAQHLNDGVDELPADHLWDQ